MASLTDHREVASYRGFDVAALETLTMQLREPTRLVGRFRFADRAVSA